MNSLWGTLRSALLLAGLVLCLAACRRAAPSPDGAALWQAVPAHTSPSSSPPIPSTPPPRMPAPAAAATAAGATVPNLESLDTLAETDPRAALLAASTQDLGPASTYVRGNLLQRWAERDFTAALAYADDFRPGPDREEMLGRLALLLAASLPAEAADIVAQDMAPGATRDEAAISVLHRWARADAASARTWAATFPPGRLRERALREVEGSVVAANAAP